MLEIRGNMESGDGVYTLFGACNGKPMSLGKRSTRVFTQIAVHTRSTTEEIQVFGILPFEKE